MPNPWPYDPQGKEIAVRIDWTRMPPQSMIAPMTKWRRVAVDDLRALTTDPRNRRIFDALGDDVKGGILTILDRPVEESIRSDEDIDTSKGALLRRVHQTIDDAENDGDLSSKLKGIELMAKLEQLLSNKQIPDPVITIQVITGVDRTPQPREEGESHHG